MGDLEIRRADITGLSVDCVVNAANSGLRAGGGVCGAIFKAAGYRRLQAACDAIGHCPTGSAVITPGFDLKARYIVHAVGPVWNEGKCNEERDLYSCYQASMKLAEENGCRSIAFPLISSGIFGYPKKEAWQTAVRAVLDHFEKDPACELQVIICVLDPAMEDLGNEVLQEERSARGSRICWVKY